MLSYSLLADFFSRSQIAKSICVVHAGGWCPTWRPVLPSTTSGRPFCDIIGYLRPLDRPFSDIIDFHRPLGRTSSDIIGFQKPLGRPFSDIIGFQRPLGRPFSDIIGFQKLLAVASLTITSSDMARCPIAVAVLGYQRMTYSWPFGGTTYFRKPFDIGSC